MPEASLNQCEEIDKWIPQLPGQVGAIALGCLYTDSQRSSKGLSPSHPLWLHVHLLTAHGRPFISRTTP